MSSLVGGDVGELILMRRSRGFIFETIVKLVAWITNVRLGSTWTDACGPFRVNNLEALDRQKIEPDKEYGSG